VGRGWAPPCLTPWRGPAPSQSTAWWGRAAPARPQAWPAGRAEAHQVPRGHCWGREAPTRPRSGTVTGPRRPRLGTGGAGRAATAIDGTPLDLEAVMEIGEMEKTNRLEWRSYP